MESSAPAAPGSNPKQDIYTFFNLYSSNYIFHLNWNVKRTKRTKKRPKNENKQKKRCSRYSQKRQGVFGKASNSGRFSFLLKSDLPNGATKRWWKLEDRRKRRFPEWTRSKPIDYISAGRCYLKRKWSLKWKLESMFHSGNVLLWDDDDIRNYFNDLSLLMQKSLTQTASVCLLITLGRWGIVQYFFQRSHSWPLFSWFSSFQCSWESIYFSNVWIRTGDLWSW